MKKYSVFAFILGAIISFTSAVPAMANNTPAVSIRVESNTSGSFDVFGTVVDDNLENYHFRVVKDGGSMGHTCLSSDAIFAPENQGYASSTLNRDACGFNFNQSVYTTVSFTDQKIATLNAADLIAFGGEGDYWLYLGARDNDGNREAVDYLLDPKVKISVTSPSITTSGSNSGTGGTTGGSSSLGGHRHDISAITGINGEVLGASTQPACVDYLSGYIKYGADNNSEDVKKLQIFLNQFFEVNNPVTGFYGPITLDMVNKFQKHQETAILLPWEMAGFPTNGPTGYVYKTTKRWINVLKCPELILSSPIPPLP